MQKNFLSIATALTILSSLLFLSPFVNTSSASSTFIDNFDRPNDNSLGPNWELFFGAQPSGIENNQAYIEVGAGGYWGFYKVSNLNIQDQDVSVTFYHQNGDTTLLARVIDLNNRIAINYYQNDSLQIYEVNNGNYRLIPNTAPNAIVGSEYTIRVRLVGNNIKVWVNGNLHADDTLNYVTSGSAGIGANDGYTKVFFDNFTVEDINGSTTTPAPSIIPTEVPTPTNTPIASPTPIQLNVPDIKQYSLPWKNKIYAFTKKTIQEFGCALTSAAMVLQYHGHNITPDTLNTWLKNQQDGYIRNGLINWLAVSRYTKLHDSNNSPTLEYKRLAGTNENLTNELNNNRPSILKVPGHFIVAKSILTDTFGINDPGYQNREDLSHYENKFLAINSYTPSHTDLSYMMFVINPLNSISLFDSNNNLITAESYIEDPITNLLNPSQKSGDKLKVLIYPKPEKENYILKVSGPKGNYTLDSYLYDVDGKVTKNAFDGRLNGSDTDKFTINFKGKKKINEKERKSHFGFWFKDKFDFFKYFKQH